METSIESQSTKSLYYPPGGILIWLIIFLEVLTFSMALVALNIYRGDEPSVYLESQGMLNTSLGLANTLILLTSGFFMAMAVFTLREGNHKKSAKLIAITMFFGLAFLVLKGFEYSDKLSHGIDIDTNSFFMFYWMLTGFHVLHVVAGLVILLYMYFKTKSGYYNGKNTFDVETSAAFWHMCDLIWLFLFPIIYLLH